MGFLKTLAWAPIAFLAVSLPLVTLAHPVVDQAGPGWVGHSRIRFDILNFVPLWKRGGRTTHLGVLALELAPGALAALLALGCRRGKSPEDNRGTL